MPELSFVLKEIDTLLHKDETNPLQLFSEYKTGESSVKLETEGDSFKVTSNGAVVLETPEARRAIAKYYREIGSIISSHSDDKDIALEFAKWNKGGGKVLTGLVKRRQKEAELYFKVFV